MFLYPLIICSLWLCYGVLSDCEWNINKDLPEKDPVFIKKTGRNYGLFYPKTKNVELKTGQRLIAACTGINNSVNCTQSSFISLACLSNKDIVFDNVTSNIKEISCSKNIAADVVNTNKTDFLPSSITLSIGFHTPFGWLELFNISYNFESITPIYSKHVIHGAILEGSYTGKASRPSFKSNGLPSNVCWTKIFTRNNQRAILENALGRAKADKYLNVTSLSKGHLSPDADFHFHSWEIATYFYANIVPQWQTINGGNWVRIENAVRHKAKELHEDLTVITGSEGVATIENNKIYLEKNNKVPVPKYIYKIVCTRRHLCISFVVTNNPFEEDDENICDNICARNYNIARWYLATYDDLRKGKVVCCDVNELKTNERFRKVVPPVRVEGILKY